MITEVEKNIMNDFETAQVNNKLFFLGLYHKFFLHPPPPFIYYFIQ